jgi:hypothetical protein
MMTVVRSPAIGVHSVVQCVPLIAIKEPKSVWVYFNWTVRTLRYKLLKSYFFNLIYYVDEHVID